MKKIILTISICALLIPLAWAQQTRTLNIQASIPPPVGHLYHLLLVDTGDSPGVSCNPNGSVARSGDRFLYCLAGNWTLLPGVWTQTGDAVHLSDSTPDDTFVGIGTTAPEFQLDVRGSDGGILAIGNPASAASLSVTGAGTRLMWYPKKHAIRAGNVSGIGLMSGAEWNDANIGLYSVAFGQDNTARANGSASLGGYGNHAIGQYSTISGGSQNSTVSNNDTVGGGVLNVADSSSCGILLAGFATVGGGKVNKALSCTATVAGGNWNQATGRSAFVGGGDVNIASGPNSTIGGGGGLAPDAGNTAIGHASIVGGGDYNSAAADVSAVFGGRDNNAYGVYGTIGGGLTNTINDTGADPLRGTAAFIGGGKVHTTTGNLSVIVGGNSNSSSGEEAFIGGGRLNNTSAGFTVIAGGRSNTASALDAVVVGGNTNVNNATGGVIGGGQNNQIALDSIHSVISGGVNNSIAQPRAAIGGGNSNTASGVASTVSGGAGNDATAQASTVGGGDQNQATAGNATVGGGIFNIASGQAATIPGGTSNIAAGAQSFAAGQNMQLDSNADRTFIFGHAGAPVSVSTPDAFIVYSGDVGIGTTAPGYKLDVNGDVNTTDCYREDGNAVAGTCASDITLKENIMPLDGSLQKLAQLNPVSFEFIEPEFGNGQQFGLIAQEVEKVFPSWVVDDKKEYKQIRYGLQLQMHLIQAVKELNKVNLEMQNTINSLKADNEMLNERINFLENQKMRMD